MPAAAIRFDAKNANAQRVAQRQAARLVTAVTRETKAAIRSVIATSIREGVPPYDAARMIRGLVGMTERQAAAARAYRAELIDSGLSMERVNTLVDRYAEKKIRERAETIARTEVMGALNEGAVEGWRQAKRDGLLDNPVKEWIVTLDDVTCPVCAPMDGVQVALDKPFQTDVGEVSAPPLHPRCRCTAAVTEGAPAKAKAA